MFARVANVAGRKYALHLKSEATEELSPPASSAHVDLDRSNRLAPCSTDSSDCRGAVGRRSQRTRPCGTVVARIRCHRAALAKTRWGDGTLATLAGRDSALLKTTPRYPQTQIRIPLGLPKTPRIYEGFCHLERFRLPIGRRALDWHAGLILPSRSLDQQTSPQYSSLLNPSSHWQTDTNK